MFPFSLTLYLLSSNPFCSTPPRLNSKTPEEEKADPSSSTANVPTVPTSDPANLGGIVSPIMHSAVADDDLIDELDSFEDLEAYVSNLGNVDTSNIDLDSDTEILFDELSRELSATMPGADVEIDTSDITDLDAEILAALNE